MDKFNKFPNKLSTSFTSLSLLFILFLSLFTIACIQFERKQAVFPKPTVNITNETVNETLNETIEEIKEKIEKKEEKVCEELSGSERINCIIERAKKSENISECFNLENESKICIYEFAKINPKYCGYLNTSNEIDLCIYNSSLEKNNESLCDRIKNSSIKEKCLISFVSEKCRNKSKSEIYLCDAMEKNDETRCNRAENREICLIRFSKEKRNVCDLIERDIERIACLSVISDDKCKILEGSKMDLCYKIYAIESEKCQECDKINSTFYSDPCYLECATKTLNSFYCSKPSIETIRDNCYNNIAFATKNPSYCDEIKLRATRAICKINIGKELLDLTICDEVEMQYKKLCYITILPLPIPVENCLKVNELYPERETCLLNAAKRERNSSICNYLSGSAKEYCLELTK